MSSNNTHHLPMNCTLARWDMCWTDYRHSRKKLLFFSLSTVYKYLLRLILLLLMVILLSNSSSNWTEMPADCVYMFIKVSEWEREREGINASSGSIGNQTKSHSCFVSHANYLFECERMSDREWGRVCGDLEQTLRSISYYFSITQIIIILLLYY